MSLYFKTTFYWPSMNCCSWIQNGETTSMKDFLKTVPGRFLWNFDEGHQIDAGWGNASFASISVAVFWAIEKKNPGMGNNLSPPPPGASVNLSYVRPLRMVQHLGGGAYARMPQTAVTDYGGHWRRIDIRRTLTRFGLESYLYSCLDTDTTGLCPQRYWLHVIRWQKCRVRFTEASYL